MAEQPPHTSLLVLNLKILRLGSWKEKGRVFSQQNLFGTRLSHVAIIPFAH